MDVIWEGFLQGLAGVWTIARVVIPLMIIQEIAKKKNILERINHKIAYPFRWIGLTEVGAFPVVVAMVFGLTFGSGIIIAHIKEGRVSPQETRIIGTFIAICHALIEDTVLFMALGVPLVLLVLPRLTAAFLLCAVVYRVMRWRVTNKASEAV